MKRVQLDPPVITHPLLVAWRREALRWARRRPDHAPTLAQILRDTFLEAKEERLRSEVDALIHWLSALGEGPAARAPPEFQTRVAEAKK